jgi:hypothetical protein
MIGCSSPKTKPTIKHLFGVENPTPYVKDGIHRYVVNDETDAVNPSQSRHQSLQPTTLSDSCSGRDPDQAAALQSD